MDGWPLRVDGWPLGVDGWPLNWWMGLYNKQCFIVKRRDFDGLMVLMNSR